MAVEAVFGEIRAFILIDSFKYFTAILAREREREREREVYFPSDGANTIQCISKNSLVQNKIKINQNNFTNSSARFSFS